MSEKKEKIIVAEDESKIQIVIRSALEKYGYEVLIAKDGLEALNLIRENPDAVALITDISMPNMTGLELVEEVRKNGPNPEIPVLVLSAYHSKDNVLKAKELKVNEFIAKPFPLKELIVRVNRMLGKELPQEKPKVKREEKKYTGSTKKILVVDDSKMILKMAEATLRKAGFNVITAENGKQGFLKATAEKPDLILTDIMMPEMDGLTLCEELRKNPQTKDIPILIISTKGQKKDVIEALQRGATGYIVKPFSPKDLATRVWKTLGLKAST
ncbi:MAG: response regulator [Synergistetes bacterium]|nr:response regulator [Synergistota bacterium]